MPERNLRTQKNSRALYVHFVRKSTDEPYYNPPPYQAMPPMAANGRMQLIGRRGRLE